MKEVAGPRLRCCVPFCGRTFRNDEGCAEVICGKHWRLAPKAWRRRYGLLRRRRLKRYGENASWLYPAGSEARIECVRLDTLLDKLWARLKAAAIETAGGL